jgi:mannose-6-phosphate isomerase
VIGRSPDRPGARARAGRPETNVGPGAASFETRPWGGFQTLEEGRGYKVKRLMVNPGHRLSLQRHRFRAEHWVVIEGSPRVWVSGQPRRLKARQFVVVPRGAWHRIENPGRVPTVIIEVQHGSYLGEDDIIRKHDDYGRAAGAVAPGIPARAAARSSPRR